MRANNNKEVNSVKKADNPIVIINGDNNKVYLDGTSSRLSVTVVVTICISLTVAILAISLCCPELLANFVRGIISIAIGG